MLTDPTLKFQHPFAWPTPVRASRVLRVEPLLGLNHAGGDVFLGKRS